jgi:hypothetical protein
MKIAFYLAAFYGALGFLATTWARAALDKYREKHEHSR